MNFNIIKQLNWIDIFLFILLFRIVFIARETGFFCEVFKVLGVIFATYISLHYYPVLAQFISGEIDHSIAKDILGFACFLFLAIGGYLLFVLLRIVLQPFVKLDNASQPNKWAGMVLGVIRGFLVVSFLCFTFMFSPFNYLSTSVKQSYSGYRLVNIAPNIYYLIWKKAASKVLPGEKFNNSVFAIADEARE